MLCSIDTPNHTYFRKPLCSTNILGKVLEESMDRHWCSCSPWLTLEGPCSDNLDDFSKSNCWSGNIATQFQSNISGFFSLTYERPHIRLGKRESHLLTLEESHNQTLLGNRRALFIMDSEEPQFQLHKGTIGPSSSLTHTHGQICAWQTGREAALQCCMNNIFTAGVSYCHLCKFHTHWVLTSLRD